MGTPPPVMVSGGLGKGRNRWPFPDNICQSRVAEAGWKSANYLLTLIGSFTYFLHVNFRKGMLPTNITKKDPATLQIDWDDGHVSFYGLKDLRRSCPCATCREARHAPPANPLRILSPNEVIADSLDVTQAEVVGRYAISFSWNDGHNTGIYSFDFLRQLCQCETCRATSANPLK
jgi:DUF971 family protein